MPETLEWCRECREEGWDEILPAAFIIWGKLFPPEALGPKCEEHAARHLPDLSHRTVSQWAVFDLRGLTRRVVPAR